MIIPTLKLAELNQIISFCANNRKEVSPSGYQAESEHERNTDSYIKNRRNFFERSKAAKHVQDSSESSSGKKSAKKISKKSPSNSKSSDSKINSARPLKRMPTIREDSHSAERLKLHKDGRFLKQKMEAEKYFKHFNDKMVKLQTITEYDLKFPLQVKQENTEIKNEEEGLVSQIKSNLDMIKNNSQASTIKAKQNNSSTFLRSGRTEIFSKASNMIWKEEKEGFSKFLQRSDTLNSFRKKEVESSSKEEEKQSEVKANKKSYLFKNKSPQRAKLNSQNTSKVLDNSNHIFFKENYEVESNKLSAVSEHNEQLWESGREVQF